MRRRRHVSERTADVALGIGLLLACVGILSIVKWVVAFCAMLFTAAVS